MSGYPVQCTLVEIFLKVVMRFADEKVDITVNNPRSPFSAICTRKSNPSSSRDRLGYSGCLWQHQNIQIINHDYYLSRR